MVGCVGWQQRGRAGVVGPDRRIGLGRGSGPPGWNPAPSVIPQEHPGHHGPRILCGRHGGHTLCGIRCGPAGWSCGICCRPQRCSDSYGHRKPGIVSSPWEQWQQPLDGSGISPGNHCCRDCESGAGGPAGDRRGRVGAGAAGTATADHGHPQGSPARATRNRDSFGSLRAAHPR